MPTKKVVSYRNSTSNHNLMSFRSWMASVVSYRNSTSNHNFERKLLVDVAVVSYRNSTSNHNFAPAVDRQRLLYLIEILHQTTTRGSASVYFSSCILSKFYIKPQLWEDIHYFTCCCILSKFYIKPQLGLKEHKNVRVVSYRNSTSNHNSGVGVNATMSLYLIEILHQTTTTSGVATTARGCILSKFYIKPQRKP